MISVIIPTLNEEKHLAKAIASIQKQKGKYEIIVSDGGSTDATLQLARPCTIVHSLQGRACQMNQGAKKAKGDVLLFLHADSALPPQAFACMKKGSANYVGGGFYLSFTSPDLFFRMVEWGSNTLRTSMTKTLFGDQGIFVKKKVFEGIGGFREDLPFLEDVLFSKRLRQEGNLNIIKKKILTSPRRFTSQGRWKTLFTYRLIMLGYHLGVPVKKLYVL
jgi:rSAM/selenodomain-associated transferase 2